VNLRHSRDQQWTPTSIDVTTPSVARMYDYYLGGKDNFAVDRDAAAKVIACFPGVPLVARQNREVMRRAAGEMATAGIRQFIDLGSGLPTQNNLHEVVQRIDPACRVVYVDNDPIVLAHGRALLDTNEQTTVITADIRNPDVLLADPDLNQLIDFTQRVGVLFVAVLHFIPDSDDPAGIIATFRDRMAAGSHLVITHVSPRGEDTQPFSEAVEIYDSASAPLVPRTRDEIEALFDGFELLEPGVVPTWQWRADGPAEVSNPPILAGVGRLQP